MKSIVDWLWRSWLFHFPKCVCWSESRFAQMLSEVEFSIASRFRRWRWFYWMKINKLNKFFVFELLESWKFTASHRCACWTNEIFFTKMNRSNFISARWLCKQFTNRFFSKENFPKMNELIEQPIHQFTKKKNWFVLLFLIAPSSNRHQRLLGSGEAPGRGSLHEMLPLTKKLIFTVDVDLILRNEATTTQLVTHLLSKINFLVPNGDDDKNPLINYRSNHFFVFF